ncbi:phosphatidylinositol N-acetylglucosaminyltransferase subunit C [Copidosoma floridanum]|uniref:phosphatidylinositol N-acetylglucosaminyltransferase subunit C n=1 Tax=Copidosoma floridanum TaxID=29053 RepID=UPI0006C9539B|nr:phosphatidylinositol N-acetylglucosaminyltransferase subunit C [Copidosoma floridanum]XP_014215205.1 phosphatidylinositol N-acetylglucosaminyltransferase subunit C [Copidosoma floridanum]XP_014215206.1 phosphatidylinositol N-acetylglucosaminyltransferase subunit C [Copidosoma floridanum]XP_014215207.1 phosphatidylinositol N-acetylglucosaminyltransferase subunit C [Copidosoma floridanum]
MRQRKKNLYENRGLPDNYTDDSFLADMGKNIKPNTATFNQAITLAASILIQLSIVILFVIVFIWINNKWTTPNVIFSISISLTVIGYIKYVNKTLIIFKRISKDLRTVLIFLAFGYILSPVLKTSTETISTDTIYTMTIFMFFIHLIFSQYSPTNVSLSESLSITSSIFGSLMLTSRLSTPLHAFSLLTVAVQCFVLLPFLLSKLNSKIYFSIILELSTLYFLKNISINFSLVFVAISVFVHFVCPVLYIKWQRYKENIYGPWDEAIVDP